MSGLINPRCFLICKFCDLKVCNYFRFPREIVGDRCPWCESGPGCWSIDVRTPRNVIVTYSFVAIVEVCCVSAPLSSCGDSARGVICLTDG
jgi:hypothetical protein